MSFRESSAARGGQQRCFSPCASNTFVTGMVIRGHIAEYNTRCLGRRALKPMCGGRGSAGYRGFIVTDHSAPPLEYRAQGGSPADPGRRLRDREDCVDGLEHAPRPLHIGLLQAATSASSGPVGTVVLNPTRTIKEHDAHSRDVNPIVTALLWSWAGWGMRVQE